MRILLVDDDPITRALLGGYLHESGFRTVEANSTDAARAKLAEFPDIGLVLLDIHMPGEDGLSLARELRVQSEIGIIVITGSRKDVVDRIIGLEIGADEYLLKPIDPREMMARVKNLTRRLESPGRASAPATNSPRVGAWTLNSNERLLEHVDGKLQRLTEGEFKLLKLLLDHAGQVVSRDQILQSDYNRDWTPTDRTVDVLISRLRRKLGDDPTTPRCILTVRGAGYRLVKN